MPALPSTGTITATIKLPTATLTTRQRKQSSIPSCARPCLDYFKSTGYSCDPSDLACLCSDYSSNGLTLGELALGCSHFECGDTSNVGNEALYGICSGVKGAVLPTHTIVTLPPFTPTSMPKEATSLPRTTGSPVSTDSSSQSFLSSVGDASATDVAGPTAPPASDAAALASEPPMSPMGASSEQSTTLTSAQAVGVSIAAMGALCLAGALIYLIAWCRKRRAFMSPKARNGSFDFIDKGAPRHSPFRHGHADPRGPLGGFAKPRVELSDNATQTNYYGHQTQQPQFEHHPGATPRSHRSVSSESRSHDSLRTVSQLLPEKAGHTPPQPQYRSPRAASVFSTATVFEEDGKTPKLLSPVMMLPMPAAPKPVLKNVPRRPERPACPSIFAIPPVDVRNPQSAATSPSKSLKKALTPSPLRSNPPPPIPTSSHTKAGWPLSTEFRVGSHQSLRPASSISSYMPDYYTSDVSRSPTQAFASSFNTAVPPRRPVPTASRSRRSHCRSSVGSDTSFESTDPDEVTPPDEQDRQLSPVAESEDSIRYPKVPRSSNQAVPRSPQPTLSPNYRPTSVWPSEIGRSPGKVHTPPPVTPPNRQTSLTGSTLAAKRLGSSAANSLSSGLYIKSNTPSQASPLKGYGRPAYSIRGGRPPLSQRKLSYAGTGYGPSPEPHTPEMQSPWPKILRTDREVVLKSPLWEPKLTPSRRGEDLYLSVSLASPGMGPGHGREGTDGRL